MAASRAAWADQPVPAPSEEARAYASTLIRRLSVRAYKELNGGEVPVNQGESVDLVDRDQVVEWLEGIAVRLHAGADL